MASDPASLDPTNRPRAVPVTVITGFLGSGKTTLLNALLRQPAMKDAAVIVNEFGEIGIDHLLVEKIAGDAVLLESGCLCCAVRGDLVDTMGRMAWQADRGDIPAFDRLAIETSGLADPAPVLQTVMADETLVPRYRLGGMAATVDAINGPDQLLHHPEAVKQVALASRLLITKTDIAPPSAIAALERQLGELNPHAAMRRVVFGEIDAAEVVADDDYDPDTGLADPGAWLGADDHGHAHGDGHAQGGDGELPGGIRSFVLFRDEPLPWPAVRAWLRSLTSLRGADTLRVKGLVNVRGHDRPVAIHGVQHVFHAPRLLDRWPDDDRRTRIVCIVRGLDRGAVSNALDAVCESLRN